VWTAALVLFHSVFGFFILPPIVRVIAVNRLSKQFGRPATIHKLRLNPYTLSATIRGFSVKDQDGAPLVSCNEVYVNFQVCSLLCHAWVFKEVSLTQPFVRVQINKDYTVNVSGIVARLSPTVPSQSLEHGKLRRWRIGRLYLTDGTVSFADLTPRVPFRRSVGPVELSVTDFRSDSDHKNAFALSGGAEGGERFCWKGSFYLAPLRSEGEFSLEGFALTAYAALYQDLFRFEIKDGVINLRSTFRYERNAAIHRLTATNTTFELKALRMVDKDTGQAAVEIPRFALSGASLDTMARAAEAETMTVTDGRFVLRRNQDTSVNAIEFLKPADSAPPTPGGILLLLRAMTNVVALLLNTTNLSNCAIRDLNLSNCAVHLEDLVNSQPVRLDLEGIAVHAKNISNRAGTNMTAEVSFRGDTNGTVRAGIKAGLSPPSAEVELALVGWNLQPLAPYLEPYLNIFVLGSKLGLIGTFRWRSPKDELPEVRFRGDATLEEFSAAEGIATEGLLQWNSLRLSGIEASLNPPAVSVAKASLEDVFARLIIETNRTINLMNALRREGTNATAAQPSTIVASAERPKFSVASVVLSNASVHFIDRSLQPNVNITVGKLQGTISGLSSDDPQRAKLRLQGTVDKTGRAEITGEINPWDSKQPINLQISVQGMDLLPGDPYAGKYLGYRLTKGKLSAQLSYQITERRLKSQNRLTFDQLTLGQTVESPDATTLPVRLAIAILRDRDGRIALEVPVDGSLDDPHFNLGHVVYRAIETVLARIVTSPFSVLAALFGGNSEDLSFQEFEPGSTNLLPAAIAKLDVLAKGLYERPELQLEIEGSTDALTDLAALRREKLNQQTILQRVAGTQNLFSAETHGPSTDDQLARRSHKVVSFEKGASALRSPPAHSSPIPIESTARGKYAAPSSPRSLADENGATALELVLAPVGAAAGLDGERKVVEGVPIASDTLQNLAADRAQNVKAYLLQTGKVAPRRITESTRGARSNGSRVYVRLQ
jgi:hypothetical protein